MKSPDMAFVSTACPEPQDHQAADRAEWADTVHQIHPSTQALHDTGFGPIPEMGDIPAPGEWRFWAVISLLCVPWAWFLVWAMT